VRVVSHVGGPPLEQLRQAFPDVEFVGLDGEEPPPPGLRADALLTLPWGTTNLGAILAGSGIRWVHVLGTGIDRFPMAALGGQTLTCSRGASAVPIAEWTLAQMLAFEKRLPETWITAPPATWAWPATPLGALAGRTLALVGLGAIGCAVAARALAFDMRVRAVRRTPAPPPLEGIEMAASLPALAAAADHLVLVAPATAATRHLLGRAVLAAVKPGVHLVNVARGSLVDQDALREALDDGRVARASLDAVEPEPLPAGHWLYAHPHVRLSPHVSWSIPGAIATLVAAFRENLAAFRAGRPLAGVVDVAAGY
jgi:phosphoglycerate dehydrogenase-like enzyme